jgi:hypothetical protein
VRVIQSLVTQVESFDWLLFHMRVPLGSARIMGLWPVTVLNIPFEHGLRGPCYVLNIPFEHGLRGPCYVLNKPLEHGLRGPCYVLNKPLEHGLRGQC